MKREVIWAPGAFQGGSCWQRSQCGRLQARCHQTTEKHISQLDYVFACGRQVANVSCGFWVGREAWQRGTERTGSRVLPPPVLVWTQARYSVPLCLSLLLCKIGRYQGLPPRACCELVRINSSAQCLGTRGASCKLWNSQQTPKSPLPFPRGVPSLQTASISLLPLHYHTLYILICSLCGEKKDFLLAMPTFS